MFFAVINNDQQLAQSNPFKTLCQLFKIWFITLA